MKYVKSCLNYTGGKYRLLKQILPLFPENINTFLDIFCGGANVGLNVNANSIICNDINAPLIQLFNYIKDNDYNIIFQEIMYCYSLFYEIHFLSNKRLFLVTFVGIINHFMLELSFDEDVNFTS